MPQDSCYLVALPVSELGRLGSIPANATVLYNDWAARLAPLTALRRTARIRLTGSTDSWSLTDRIVQATWGVTDQLRDAAKDHDIATAFEEARGEIFNPHVAQVEGIPDHLAGNDIAVLVRRTPDSDGCLLFDQAIPILLGLIILTTIRPGISYSSQAAFLENQESRRIEPGLAPPETEPGPSLPTD